ncbi:MAG: glycosyltransferase family 9 protein [Melioribacteraceae bacterium]|nr:MAG: glycosyltransferase family 9 protein [Melioribacteraceae bacterium]
MIIRLSSLGDVLLTTPVISALQQKFPNTQIDFLVKPQFLYAVKTNPILNHIYEFDKSKNIDLLLKSLQKNKYNLVIDLQNNFRSRKISSKLSAKVYRFKKPTLNKFLLVNFKWNLFKKVKSIPQMYFESIPGLDFNFQKPSLFVPEEVISSVKPGKYIGFAPGSKHFTKMWPIEYFNELGKLLSAKGYTILLFGGSDDKEICHNLKQEIPGAIDLSTENDLIQIARDMKECKLIVCNDSGLMHTAVSVDVPVIAIFGSTVKEFGFAPYSENSLVIENEELKCRPCSHIGKDKCPKSHFKCMLELTPELVHNKIEKFISL